MFIEVEDQKLNNSLKPSDRWFRLGAMLIDDLIASVTIVVGWLIWSFFLWKDGTTPGHKLLKQKIVSAKTGETFGVGRMFVREVLVKGILLYVGVVFTLGLLLIVDSLFIFRKDNRTLHDWVCGSIVVDM